MTLSEGSETFVRIFQVLNSPKYLHVGGIVGEIEIVVLHAFIMAHVQ